MTSTAAIHNPIDGTTIDQVPAATPEEIQVALRKARAAQVGWAAVPVRERGEILMTLADAVERRGDDFAAIESKNIGRATAAGRNTASNVAKALRFFGGMTDKVFGHTIPVEDSLHTYTVREPHGVVAAIVPWNAPLYFAGRKIAPAIAFGNACVLKPAEETPLTSLLLQEVLLEAGLPDGVVQVLPGGRDVGEALVRAPETDFVIFTGSDVGGRAVARTAAETLKPVALELGGKSPQLVFDDADLDVAIEPIAMGAYYEVGQACIAGSRVLVQEAIHDEFVSRLDAFTQTVTVGDPNQGRAVGPQITRVQQRKTLEMVDQAKQQGATVASTAPLADEARDSDGYWVQPTVFTDVTPDMELWREEVFGPVIAVVPFTDEAQALQLAHDTEFGLAAGVWTRDLARAHRVASKLKVGMVWINEYGLVNDQVPFGGVGRSGYGHEGGWSALETYTRVKAVWTSLK